MITAALFDGPGQPLRFVRLPKPLLRRGEALVRVSLCTVCGSDIHTIAGTRTEPTPCVLGHEVVGVVEDVAGEVRDHAGNLVRIGERVVWSVAVGCGDCFFCHRQLPQKCERLRKYGHTQHTTTQGPLGGFASHVHLWPNTAIIKVPDPLPDGVAAVAMCATATVAAMQRAGGPAETAIVFGAGMLGLTASAMAAASGTKVVVVETDAARRELARKFGASTTCEPIAIAEVLTQITEGRGFDVAYECTGNSDVTQMALSSLRIGGSLVLAGAVFPTEPLSLQPEVLIRRLLTIRGVHNYSPDNLQTAITFLANHHDRFPFAELVTQEFALVEIETALSYAIHKRPVRIGLRP